MMFARKRIHMICCLHCASLGHRTLTATHLRGPTLIRMPNEPQIRVEWIGTEREPVVTIDGFANNAEALRDAAAHCNFDLIGEYYPGERAAVSPRYFDGINETLRTVQREFFGYREGSEVIRSYYSMATTPPHLLSLPQRIPHTDAYDDDQIAVLHFLGHDDLGGTGFFRHLSTGFESVNAQRVEKYHTSLAADFERHGEPEPAYIGAQTPLFERFHLSEHRFNRALVYRGKLLHCAALDTITQLPDNIEHGRLTIASFLRPRLGGRKA